MEEENSNTLRVLIATDCHLGYMEKDEVRRFDSFQAFEEICSIADQKQVDMLLLGGDLFHENKPSRSTLVKCIEILRKHCLNDRPVQYQVVSDQTVNFQSIFGHVNYEDPHFNVGLPVFTIHGNHDDPAGVDNLSAIDILSACNLVNYFGKMVLGGSGVGQITVYPILIKKGTTSVALYGLGNIRDERLNRMFQTPHAVQWMRPETQDGAPVSDWFNILVLHQNRIKTNPKNAINEHFLPRFLDFIIWGHEHECLVDPQEVPGMGFHITQPGSSVATSLIDGEAKPKHVLLLEIKGSQYRPTKIPLKSVRPFEYAEVVLKDEADVDPNDQASVLEYLDKVVKNLIEKSSNASASSRSQQKLPLVRVKVDYSGFSTINPQRFGQKYVGKVANPQDILIFSKAAKKRQTLQGTIDESEKLRPEELNQQNIEALVAESNLQMEILPVNDLDIALHDFVNKDDKTAFYACLQRNLEETRSKLNSEADNLRIEEEEIIVKVNECMQERAKQRALYPKDSIGGVSSSSQSLPANNRGKTLLTAPTSTNAFSDDETDYTAIPSNKRPVKDTTATSTRGGGASRRGRGRGRGKGKETENVSPGYKQLTLDSLKPRQSPRTASISATTAGRSIAREEVDSSASEGEDETFIETSEPEESVQGRGRKRGSSTRGRGRGGSTPAKRGRKNDNSSSSSLAHSLLMHHDDDGDDDDDVGATNRNKKAQPARVTKKYGSIKKR
ncbi:hypothetical protein LUZ60_004707 [Juncus effusus]|nr:hypothetical protein LUZ60_004707 [Juncus effusus]